MERRVEMHSNIFKPLSISDVYFCLVIRGDEFEFKGTKSERGSVAKRPNNASGQRLCLSTLISLYNDSPLHFFGMKGEVLLSFCLSFFYNFVFIVPEGPQTNLFLSCW